MARETAWPAIGTEPQRWVSQNSATSVAAGRGHLTQSGRYESAVPARIAVFDINLSSDVAAKAEDASYELARFDSSLGMEIAAFGSLLLRSEAAASSRIENLTASARAVLSAELGDTSRGNARAIVANTRAMHSALRLADTLTPDTVRAMHAVLMHGNERHTPGEWRTEPVWIGKSGSSPIGADYVGPAHDRIAGLMDDVMTFARRNDLPVLTQVAVTHAQFETIHPFTDGNGRTGRALMQAMLRGKNLTRKVTVPVSAGLLVDVDSYHRALMSYRAGDVEPIVSLTADASFRAVVNATQLVAELRQMQEQWRSQVKARSDSAAWKVLEFVTRQPVFNAALVAEHLGVSPTNVYRNLEPLVKADVLQQKTEHNIGILWRSDEVLGALDRFADRAGRRGMPTQ